MDVRKAGNTTMLDALETVHDTIHRPDMRMLRMEMEAARFILAHPDSHTTAELEDAQLRGRECADIYFAELDRNLREAFANISVLMQKWLAQVAPAAQQIMVAIGRAFGLALPPAPHRDRAALRAAKRRARLSTLVRQRPRQRRTR